MSSFRDLNQQFAEADAQVLGVSTDDLDTQKSFAESVGTPFPLAVAPDGTTARAYGVLTDSGRANRVTFVIDAEGVVKEVLEGANALDPAGALDACQRGSE